MPRNPNQSGWMNAEIRGPWRNLRGLIHAETHPTRLDSNEVRHFISRPDDPASSVRSHLPRHIALSGWIAIWEFMNFTG